MSLEYLHLILLTGGILIGIGLTLLTLAVAAHIFMEKE